MPKKEKLAIAYRSSGRISVVAALLSASAACLMMAVLLRPSRAASPITAPRGRQLWRAENLRAREQYLFSRRGYQFGIPEGALANAVAQMRSMEAAQGSGPNAINGPAASYSWRALGPAPMHGNQPNFGGFPLFQNPPAANTSQFDSSGRVSALAIDSGSGNIYVGTASGGVWLSTDGGTTFAVISDNMQPPVPPGSPAGTAALTEAIGSIGIDTSTTPHTVYVGTGEGNASESYYGNGLFTTQDNGAHWTFINQAVFQSAGGQNSTLQTFETLASACGHLFAGTGTEGLSSNSDVAQWPEIAAGGFVFESIDGGASWHRTFPFSGSANVRSFSAGSTVDFADPTLVLPAMYATLDQRGLFQAQMTCSGTPALSSFQDITPELGLPAYPAACVPAGGGAPAASTGRSSVAANTTPSNLNTRVYAIPGSPLGAEFRGFFESTDHGQSFAQMTTPCATTANGGVTWSTTGCGTGNLTIDGDVCDPTGALNVFAISFYAQTLLIDPSSPNTVYFGSAGIYRSTDAGASWAFLGITPGGTSTHTDQHALAMDPTHYPHTLWVGNDGGLFSFDTVSNTWTAHTGTAAPGADTHNATTLVINSGQSYTVGPHPTQDDRVLAGFQDNGVQLDTVAPPNQTWNVVDTGDASYTFFVQANPNTAYHAFGGSRGLGVSTNAGATWTFTNSFATFVSGLGNSGISGFFPLIAVDPNPPAGQRRLFVGAHSVFVSTDGMGTWSRQVANNAGTPNGDVTGCPASNSGFCAIADLQIVPADNRRAWSVSAQSGGFPLQVFNTTQANLNTGAVWNNVSANLGFNPTQTQATSIAVSAHNADLAYLTLSSFTAVTHINHIYRTTDFGAHWAAADGGLPDIPVLRAMIDNTDPTDLTVLAGTEIGVFRSTNGGASWSPFNL